MTLWPPYIEWDLTATGLLPADWEAQVHSTIHTDAIHTVLSGTSEQSREMDGNYELPILVVSGEACNVRMPWLRGLYEKELREFASQGYGHPLFVARDVRSSINVNCLRGVGARYEAHVDTNTVTGVLFVSNVTELTGGELVFAHPDKPNATVLPKAGVFIAFDARTIPHFVAPLKTAMDRISIPMNYYDHPDVQYRPAGLDERLYTVR